MLPDSQRSLFGDSRFDGRRARRILAQAVREQHRLDTAREDTWTLEELEAMAAEARISPEALRAAIERRAAGPGRLGRSRPGRLAVTGKGMVLAGIAAIVLLGALIAFPTFAQVFFWTMIALGVLVLLGASPV